MAYYKDLREHIQALEKNGKLIRVKRQINKDTELMPIVRWQLRGLPERERKAFLFENVVDVKGKKYDIPVIVGAHAISDEVYALGMMCEPGKIMEKWTQAQLHPIAPVMVNNGPTHEVVHVGETLLEHGGLSEIPVPISTPGFDNAPYFTCANWVSKDPETGVSNIGNYRGMIKSPTRTGIKVETHQDLRIQWEKCQKKGIPLQAAIVIGASPAISFTATVKLPYGVEEYGVAGGIAGEPIELVKCKTVDIEVPASSEIIIEGIIPTDSVEREAPFGEYTGYMGSETMGPYFNVTCITHRRNPIYSAFISQLCPSESSKLKVMGNESALYKFLRYDCGLPVQDVALAEVVGAKPYCVIKMRKLQPHHVWQALHGAIAMDPGRKFVIAVDEDIDPRDHDSVIWALSFRVQPQHDVRIIQGQKLGLDPSANLPGTPEQYLAPTGAAAVLIDATRKWAYPPVSLPKKEYMDRARQIWEEEGWGKLTPKVPWHGYQLGHWTKENEEEAELALKGEHFETGKKLASQRVKL